MIALLAWMLVGLVPFTDVVTDYVDVIELNHFYDGQGRHVFDQVLFWDSDERSGDHQVRAWRMYKTAAQMPRYNERTGEYVTVWHDTQKGDCAAGSRSVVPEDVFTVRSGTRTTQEAADGDAARTFETTKTLRFEMPIKIYGTPGTYSLVPPAGVPTANLVDIQSGGGGGGGASIGVNGGQGGGGGGGCQYVNFPWHTSAPISITVGAGGAPYAVGGQSLVVGDVGTIGATGGNYGGPGGEGFGGTNNSSGGAGGNSVAGNDGGGGGGGAGQGSPGSGADGQLGAGGAGGAGGSPAGVSGAMPPGSGGVGGFAGNPATIGASVGGGGGGDSLDGTTGLAASGGDGQVAFQWTVPTPNPTSVTPAIGIVAGGTRVTIHGDSFSGYVTGSPIVTIGGNPATSVVVVSDTQITCVTPAGTLGTADVVVTNEDNVTGTGSGIYTYGTPPAISGDSKATLSLGVSL